MCFYNDYDWSAQIINTTEGPADKPVNCHECPQKIQVGEWRRKIYMQEHELCQLCEDDCSDVFDEEINKNECKHEYGQRYTYYCCQDCDKVLQAVKAHEVEAGCPAYAQQPPLGELWVGLQDSGEGHIYAAKAIAMFPELAGTRNISYLLQKDEDTEDASSMG